MKLFVTRLDQRMQQLFVRTQSILWGKARVEKHQVKDSGEVCFMIKLLSLMETIFVSAVAVMWLWI